MSGESLRPDRIAAATLVIAGVFVLVLPQHGSNAVRLAIVTVAAAAGLYALAVNAPPRWWLSPFDGGGGRGRQRRDEIGWIRAALASPRQRLAPGLALPPDTVRLLQPLIVASLERAGVDPRDPEALATARTLVTPLTRAVLTSKPPKRPGWLRLLADERATAAVVHRVLDDLERLDAGDSAHATMDEHERSETA